jgi:hypothetical protein
VGSHVADVGDVEKGYCSCGCAYGACRIILESGDVHAPSISTSDLVEDSTFIYQDLLSKKYSK